jgi:hypothetical protein
VSKTITNFFSLQFCKISDFGTRNVRILIYVLIGILSLDTVINQISGGLGIAVSSPAGVALFVAIGLVTIIVQLFVLQFVSKISFSIRSKVRHLRRMHTAVTVIQYATIVLFLYVMVEIVVTRNYSPISSIMVTTLNYTLSILLMGIFTTIFLSWYKSNRTSVLVLLYGLSFATVVVASVSILSVFIYVFNEQMPEYISSTSDPSYLKTKEGSIWKVFSKIYSYSDMASFFLKWGGTALMLYHYSHKLGKLKYWFLLSLPLAYFSISIIYHLNIYAPEDEFGLMIFIGVGSLNATFGGILFYLAFSLTSKTFSGQVLGDYLLIAGFGFMLFFSATQANVITTIYPPFGFATISTYGLGSYLILLGLYLSALSISQDEQLRSVIKRSTLSESKFLHTIGTSAAERNKVILNSVMSKAKRQQQSITKDIGIETSLNDEDIIDYVKEIEKKEEEDEVQEGTENKA